MSVAVSGWNARQLGSAVIVGIAACAAKYARPWDTYGAPVICTTPISRPPWIVPNESKLSMKALNRAVNVAGGVTVGVRREDGGAAGGPSRVGGFEKMNVIGDGQAKRFAVGTYLMLG